MRVLGIDQGTSSTKAVVVDEDGTVVAWAEHPVTVVARVDGAVEIDPEELYASVLSAAQQAVSASGGIATIDAIGLANQGETILAWSSDTTQARSAAIVWQDRRSAELCERLAADGWRDRLAAISGLELDPYFVAPKVAWLRASVGSDVTIGTTDTWMLQRLTGAFVTDAATASRSLLLDLDHVTWSDEACEAFGIDASALPTIVDNAGPIGITTAFGGTGVPVTGACVDQQAALFAERCFGVGEAKCTYGTGAFLLATTGATPARSAGGLSACVAWRLAGQPTWCLDGQVFTVGAAVSWLERIGLISGPEDLDALGGNVDDTGGAAFVPGLAGLAAPFWRPQARGAFTGLSLATERGHLVRALVEGIAAQVALLARAVQNDLGSPLRRLRVDGGLIRSRLLLQTQADLLQAPIEVYPSPHATALGVAAMARLGSSGGALDDVVSPWTPSLVVEPQISAGEADERLARWLAVAEATYEL